MAVHTALDSEIHSASPGMDRRCLFWWVGGVADNMAHIVPLVGNYNLLGECPIPSILKKNSFAVLENGLAHCSHYKG
jgi:hypothetical protein